MKPTKHNPVARAARAKKPSVVPSKKYEGPLVEDWETEGGKTEPEAWEEEAILAWYKNSPDDAVKPKILNKLVKRGIKIK